MAFTQTGLDNVQSAIMDHATGQRIVRLHIGQRHFLMTTPDRFLF